MLQSTGIGKAAKKLSKHKDPLLTHVSVAFRTLMGAPLPTTTSSPHRPLCTPRRCPSTFSFQLFPPPDAFCIPEVPGQSSVSVH